MTKDKREHTNYHNQERQKNITTDLIYKNGGIIKEY